jgi:hypothetical protein
VRHWKINIRGDEMKVKVSIPFIALSTFLIFASVKPASPQQRLSGSDGAVYVPVYTSIFHGHRAREFRLSVTLSIHNIDMKHRITLYSIEYHDKPGKIIRKILTAEKTLKPLETMNFVLEESGGNGGVGANFIVKWKSSSRVNRPIVETIMIGTGGQQGISFASRGVTILSY